MQRAPGEEPAHAIAGCWGLYPSLGRLSGRASVGSLHSQVQGPFQGSSACSRGPRLTRTGSTGKPHPSCRVHIGFLLTGTNFSLFRASRGFARAHMAAHHPPCPHHKAPAGSLTAHRRCSVQRPLCKPLDDGPASSIASQRQHMALR